MSWLDVLREQCEKRSQAQVSKMLGYSPAVINQVLKQAYKGNLNKVEMAVKGCFMAQTVSCPVLGEIQHHHCLNYQKLPFAAINPQRVQLYKACHGDCPHGLVGGKRDRPPVVRVDNYIFRQGNALRIRIGKVTVTGFSVSQLVEAQLKRDALLAQRELAKRNEPVREKYNQSYGRVERNIYQVGRRFVVEVAGKKYRGFATLQDARLKRDTLLSDKQPEIQSETQPVLPVKPAIVRTDRKDGAYCIDGQYQAVLNGRVYPANSAEEAVAIVKRGGVKNPCGRNTANYYVPTYDIDKQLSGGAR